MAFRERIKNVLCPNARFHSLSSRFHQVPGTKERTKLLGSVISVDEPREFPEPDAIPACENDGPPVPVDPGRTRSFRLETRCFHLPPPVEVLSATSTR